MIPCTTELKLRILILNTITPFLIGTAIDLYVPSLPAIVNFYHTSESLVQLSIALYMLGYSAGQIFFGVLADCYGRRKILLGSILLFTVASFIAAWSPNIYVLNTCRLLQGLAVSGLAVIRVVAMDCFTGLELTKTINSISICWAMGPIIGPYIGGYLQHYFGWQADFYFFGIYGAVITLYAFFYIPETHFARLPLNLRHISQAIAEIAVSPVFLCYSIVIGLSYGMIVVFNVVGPFLLQVVLKYSVIEYGRIALYLGFAYFLGNFSNRFIINYLPSMWVAIVSIIGSVVTGFLMVTLGYFFGLNLYLTLIPVFLLFFQSGWIFPNVAGMILNLFQKNSGIVSATMGAIQIGMVFLLSSFASGLKTSSQMPLAMLYLVVTVIIFVLFFVGKSLERQLKINNVG